MQKKNIIIFIVCMIVAIASRLLPHWHNFTAVGAASLFGGFYFRKSLWPVLVPVGAIFISNLILNNLFYAHYFDGFVWWSENAIWVIIAFLSAIPIGWMIQKIKVTNLLVSSILISLFFYLISNLGVWAQGMMYPKTLAGLQTCYIAAIPYFWNTLLSNVLFVAIIFGVYAWYEASKQNVTAKTSGA